ncbi:MAG: hypothetical protein ABW278_01640 [Steroidobacteraceae bacterium]
MPTSVALLGMAILVAVLLRGVLLLVLPTPLNAPAPLIIGVGIAVTLLFLKAVLGLAHHPERFTQTATAVFGYQIVLAPALIATGWLFLTVGENPTWQLPALILRLAVEVWALAVSSRILRSATGWPLFACVALAIVNELLTFLAIAAFVPQADTPGVAAPV